MFLILLQPSHNSGCHGLAVCTQITINQSIKDQRAAKGCQGQNFRPAQNWSGLQTVVTTFGVILWKWKKYKITMSLEIHAWGEVDYEKGGGSAQNYMADEA